MEDRDDTGRDDTEDIGEDGEDVGEGGREEAVPFKRPETLTLSTGAVLKIRPVGAMLIFGAIRRLEEPEVPVMMNEDKGREEPNELDPAYQKAVQQYWADRSDLIQKTYILLGTSILEVPDGMQRPEDEEWLDDLEAVGIEVKRTDRRERYVAWVKFVAMAGEADDTRLLLEAFGNRTSVTETAAQQAMDSFRGDQGRPANRAARRAAARGNRD